MDNKFNIFTISLVLLILGSCSTTKKEAPYRHQPRYVGVDKLAKPYVDEYMELSVRNNLVFHNKVTIGFTNIAKSNVIGTCTFARGGFREIDLDVDFFVNASEISRKSLVFHELTHCYCTRGHDYGENQDYETGIFSAIQAVVQEKIPWCLIKSSPGYFDDGCSTSIMHPVIPSVNCLDKHFEHYKKEMFNRCILY